MKIKMLINFTNDLNAYKKIYIPLDFRHFSGRREHKCGTTEYQGIFIIKGEYYNVGPLETNGTYSLNTVKSIKFLNRRATVVLASRGDICGRERCTVMRHKHFGILTFWHRRFLEISKWEEIVEKCKNEQSRNKR